MEKSMEDEMETGVMKVFMGRIASIGIGYRVSQTSN